jgi:hypothetical protein
MPGPRKITTDEVTNERGIKSISNHILSRFEVVSNGSNSNNLIHHEMNEKSRRAGGLAWLGYRLDMAGTEGSNPFRPTFFFFHFPLIIAINQIVAMG